MLETWCICKWMGTKGEGPNFVVVGERGNGQNGDLAEKGSEDGGVTSGFKPEQR